MANEVDDKLLKSLGINKADYKPGPPSKLKAAHESVVADDNKLGHFICTLMNRLMKKGIDPKWINYCGSADWAVHAMNLSEESRGKFASKWAEIYKQLMQPEEPNDDTSTPIPGK